ncbi:IS4 family transposase [Alicyclobacillus ferrooxydans]|uniref:Transposase n=1 Tax=Alicyclobacillus ferrooxydans TaxID=471514 RepID=A0A0P9D8R9_9BACL|nr:IS4 family transposase [Alicyclobacillus ferrooxydans]KPV45790.1 hypothetical protein AN477_00095 [Alicyclobacillus ferrooxydans]
MDNATLKSCFGQWLSLVDPESLQASIAKHGADRYVKKLSTSAVLRLFLYAQLVNASGLRDLEIAVRNDDALQQELGLDSISISQLSRTCARIPTDVFRGVFLDLVKKTMATIHTDKPYAPLLGLVKIIDSTTIPLCLSKYQWATFRKTKAGVKVHTRICFHQPDRAAPDKVQITSANVADSKLLSRFVDSSDAMYVFDRGYLDYAMWDDFCEKNIRFATRLKENAVYDVLDWNWSEFDEQSGIIHDNLIRLGSASKQMVHQLRRIVTLDTKGNRIVILTNDYFTPADELAELYRNRWKIELFFRWMKQHLKTTAFFGTSQTAVENQIYIALIAYLLMFLAQHDLSTTASLLTVQRLLKTLLWKTWDELLSAVHRKAARTSRGRQKRRE